MTTQWTPKTLTLTGSGPVAALLILPNLGKGLQGASYVIDAVPTAYAAREQAEAVDDKFERYLVEQQAYTRALNEYTEQLQQQQVAPPALERWWDDDDRWWVCSDHAQTWWANEDGTCE